MAKYNTYSSEIKQKTWIYRMKSKFIIDYWPEVANRSNKCKPKQGRAGNSSPIDFQFFIFIPILQKISVIPSLKTGITLFIITWTRIQTIRSDYPNSQPIYLHTRTRTDTDIHMFLTVDTQQTCQIKEDRETIIWKSSTDTHQIKHQESHENETRIYPNW